MEKIVTVLTGPMANNPLGVSSKPLQHLLIIGKTAEGKPQFESVGAIKIEEAVYKESPFSPANASAAPKAKL